jgi:hypothetical protein
VTWFKVDDNLAFHPKVIAAGNLAMGLWVRAGSWAAQQLTDGFVPAAMIGALGGTDEDAGTLVQVGLWEVEPGGWRFHEWSTNGRQPTRAQVEDRRAKTAERVAAWRSKRSDEDKSSSNTTSNSVGNGVTGGVTNAVTNGVSNGGGNAAPDPTRPDPTRSNSYGVTSERKTRRVKRAPVSVDPEAPTFDDFYRLYPLKKEPDRARTAWGKAIGKADPKVIIDGVHTYIDELKRTGTYCKHPATWLNAACWADEPTPDGIRGGHPAQARNGRRDPVQTVHDAVAVARQMHEREQAEANAAQPELAEFREEQR